MEATDIVINFLNKPYPVTPGFTRDEFVDTLKATFPEATNATLIEDGVKNGVEHYTLKPNKGQHG